MIFTRRAASIVSVLLLTVPALSGCGAGDGQHEPTSSSATSPASPTTSPTTSTSVISAVPAPPEAAATAPGEKVPAADLAAVVANRTYRGDFDGEYFAEYYLPDGTLHGMAGDRTYIGSWQVVGEQLCFTYPNEGVASEVDCYSVFKDGDTLSWIGTDGTMLQPAYVEGNPDNL